MTTPSAGPRVPALIFGADIAPLGVLRALAARGVPCFVGDDTTGLITRSRWYVPPGRTLSETSDSDELVEYLTALDLERAVVYACTDRWALAAAGIPTELRRRFMISASDRDTVEQLTDKDRFGALVARLDIPHPATREITSVADVDALTDDQIRDGFLKPTSSQLHRRHFGAKGAFVTSREAAVRQVEAATRVGIEYVFQEWIPGGHAASILIDGIVDRTGAIPVLTARRKVREYPRRLGTTSSSVGIRPESVADAVDSVRRLLTEIGYRGFFNIEFKLDRRDGRHKIIEFNPRPCWYTGTIASGGVDLPWLAYFDAQDLPLPETGTYPAGRHALYEFGDAKAIVGALAARRRPEGSVLRTWLTGDRAVFWWRDPMPALGGMFAAFGRRIGRLVGRSQRARDPVRSA
jgi:predicted ATP-grasp superfamily ATP-dependent carboligase